jgi:hypothetical protein
MIRIVGAVLCLLFPSLASAHESAVDTCAVQEPLACSVVFDLPGLSLQHVEPVVLPDGNLRVLAASPEGQVELVDFSLQDGSVLRRQIVDLRLGPDEHYWRAVFGEFSTDGETLVVFAAEKGDEPGARLFDADGERIGFLPSQALETGFLASETIQSDWGYDDTATDLFALLIEQNLVQLRGRVLSGTLYRFELVADLGLGTFELRETRKALDANDTFPVYMKRRFALDLDPVGHEDSHYIGEIGAVTAAEGDGRASTVYAMDRNKHRVFYDQHLGVENGRFLTYRNARISSDGEYLAVLRTGRSDEADPGHALMVFRTVTAREILVADLPSAGWSNRALPVWLADGRIAVLQSHEGEGTKGFVFALPGQP